MSYNPGSGPYNNPQITISTPLQPPPQQFTNMATVMTSSPDTVHVMLFLNGLLLVEGAGADYTRTGAVVTMAQPPAGTDVLTARVFVLGLQLGGSTPQRYVVPWTFVLTGPYDGASVIYTIDVGPTISGDADGTNNLFTWGVALSRAQIWRNGVLQTSGLDCANGPTAVVFMPRSIPQPGDIITILGYQ